MQPMNLKAIARDAALRGDTKTLLPARAGDANRHLHGFLHRTRGNPPARGAPTAGAKSAMWAAEKGGGNAAHTLSKCSNWCRRANLFDHLVGEHEERGRDGKVEASAVPVRPTHIPAAGIRLA
jgi:hypothetical protein